jgi:hypothetical protein
MPSADGAMNQLTKQLSNLCQALNRTMQQMTTVSGTKTGHHVQTSATWSDRDSSRITSVGTVAERDGGGIIIHRHRDRTRRRRHYHSVPYHNG